MSSFANPWTTTERSILMRLKAGGASLQDIADALPMRSRKAVGNFISRQGLTGKPKRHRSEPAPKPPEEIAWSACLRDATLIAISQFAKDNCVTEQEARSLLLGREPIAAVIRRNFQTADTTGHSPFELVSGRFPPKTQANLNAVYSQSAEA